MVNWLCVHDDQAREEWDTLQYGFTGATYLQSYKWGLYRSQFGWRVVRWIAIDSTGAVVCMLQALFRAYPGSLGLLWAPGGPIGDLSCCDAALQAAMADATGCRHLYCRLNLTRPYHAEDALKLSAYAWRRALIPITSGLSLDYNPAQNDEALMAQCSANWRHNLRRAGKHNLQIVPWNNPDAGTMAAIYASMQAYKNIGEQFSAVQISSLLQIMGDKIILYRCDNAKGEPVSLRGCIVQKQKAWDLFAATSSGGRKLYASNLLLWELMAHCRRIGVRSYDLGGVDPQSNRGVYDFKKGTGAAPLEYLGEWDWSTSKALQLGASWIISKKRERL
jgi:lipid II:glycine glycyltransferase (peptidoglycan interpeptide bridge formation enzyme)